jgi:hypothetical protein
MILRGRSSLAILSTLKKLNLELIGKKDTIDINTIVKSNTFQTSVKYFLNPCPYIFIAASSTKNTVDV